jgi:hypothetical protein
MEIPLAPPTLDPLLLELVLATKPARVLATLRISKSACRLVMETLLVPTTMAYSILATLGVMETALVLLIQEACQLGQDLVSEMVLVSTTAKL